MTHLEQKRDDRADDENRLESLADDDEKGLKKCLEATARRSRQLDDLGHVRFDRVAGALGATNVVRPHRRFEVGEERLHGRNHAGVAPTGGCFDRLEREIRVERLVASVGLTARAHGGERLLEQRERILRRQGTIRQAGAVARSDDAIAGALVHRERPDVRNDTLHLRVGEIARGWHRRPRQPTSNDRPQLCIAALGLPCERADLGRHMTQRARERRVTSAQHAVALHAALSEYPLPLGHLHRGSPKRCQIRHDIPTLLRCELAGEAGHRCSGNAD